MHRRCFKLAGAQILAWLIALSVACGRAAGPAPNPPAFLTVDPDDYFHRLGADESWYAAEAARKAREARPAEADPEGHWGEARQGMRLSLRLAQETFHPGEPVMVIVLVRSVSPGTLSFIESECGLVETNLVATLGDNAIRVRARSQMGTNRVVRSWGGLQGVEMAAEKRRESECSRRRIVCLPPGRQRRYSVDLRDMLDLDKPGVYHVQAVWQAPNDGAPLFAKAQSGVEVDECIYALAESEAPPPTAGTEVRSGIVKVGLESGTRK